MLDKTIFKLNKALFYIKLNKKTLNLIKSIDSPEAYLKFLSDEEKNYKSSPLIATDKYAVNPANIENLFINIKEYDVLKSNYSFPFDEALTDIENAISIMAYFTEHTFYSGASLCILPDNSLEILNYSFNNGFSHSINCRFKSIVFSDILNSYGIKALPVCLRNNENGCHFITHVYSREQNKFVAFDPSFNCYFTDDNNNFLSVFELRDCFINNEIINIVGYDLFKTEKFKKLYKAQFIKDCLANISTWNTNKRNFKSNAKIATTQFDTAVPQNL